MLLPRVASNFSESFEKPRFGAKSSVPCRGCEATFPSSITALVSEVFGIVLRLSSTQEEEGGNDGLEKADFGGNEHKKASNTHSTLAHARNTEHSRTLLLNC